MSLFPAPRAKRRSIIMLLGNEIPKISQPVPSLPASTTAVAHERQRGRRRQQGVGVGKDVNVRGVGVLGDALPAVITQGPALGHPRDADPGVVAAEAARRGHLERGLVLVDAVVVDARVPQVVVAGAARVGVVRLAGRRPAAGVVEVVVRGVHAVHGPAGRLDLGRGAEDLVDVVLEVRVEGAGAAADARLGTLLAAHVRATTVFLVFLRSQAPTVVSLVVIRPLGEITLMRANFATKVTAHHRGCLFLAQDGLGDGAAG